MKNNSFHCISSSSFFPSKPLEHTARHINVFHWCSHRICPSCTPRAVTITVKSISALGTVGTFISASCSGERIGHVLLKDTAKTKEKDAAVSAIILRTECQNDSSPKRTRPPDQEAVSPSLSLGQKEVERADGSGKQTDAATLEMQNPVRSEDFVRDWLQLRSIIRCSL